MEELRQILMDSVSGGFWRFIGYWIIIALIVTVPLKLLKILIVLPFRQANINKHGWPPPHIDATGKKIKKKDKEE
jgi:hypothetical protein